LLKSNFTEEKKRKMKKKMLELREKEKKTRRSGTRPKNKAK
jgi:hypothetical protein